MKKTLTSLLALVVAFILVISSSVVSFAAPTVESVAKDITDAIAKLEVTENVTSAEFIAAARKAAGESGAEITWAVEPYVKKPNEGLKTKDMVVVPGVNGAAAGVLNIKLGETTKKVPFVKSIEAPMAERDYTVSTDDEFDIEDGILISYNGVADLVIVPKGVTEIDNYCFTGNEDIKALILPEGIEAVSSLKGMTALEAFYGPESLKNFAAAGNVNTNGYTFSTNKAETANPIKYVKLSSSIEELPAGTFMSCQLTDFYIGPNVEYVGNWFLLDNYVSDLVIPANVKSIGHGAMARQGRNRADEVINSLTILNPDLVYEQYQFDDGVFVNPLTLNNKEVIVRTHEGSSTVKNYANYVPGDNRPAIKWDYLNQSISEVAAMAQWAVNNIYKDAKAADLILRAAQAQNANTDITITWDEPYAFDGKKASGTIIIQSAADSIVIDVANGYAAEAEKDSSGLGGLFGGGKDDKEEGGINLTLIIIIAAAVVVVALIVVLIIVIVKKNNNDDDEDEEDEDEDEDEDEEE